MINSNKIKLPKSANLWNGLFKFYQQERLEEKFESRWGNKETKWWSVTYQWLPKETIMTVSHIFSISHYFILGSVAMVEPGVPTKPL